MPDQGSGWKVDYLTRSELEEWIKPDPLFRSRIVLELSSARGLHVPARSNARRQTLYIDDAAGDPVPWFQCDLMGRSVTDGFFTKGGGRRVTWPARDQRGSRAPAGRRSALRVRTHQKTGPAVYTFFKRLVLNCGLAVNQQVMVDDGKMAFKT
jgi:hypothetical protein